MPRATRDGRYSAVAIAFHWTTAFLVIVNLVIGIGHEWVPAMRAWMPGHKSIGILVLLLTIGRIAWRLAHRPPPLPSRLSALERAAAHAVHWGLYALLLAMPLSGWLMVSGTDKRRPLDLFGLVDVPYLPVGTAAGDAAHAAHGLFGWIMVALVALHVAAALRHHFILRDTVLARMAPIFTR